VRNGDSTLQDERETHMKRSIVVMLAAVVAAAAFPAAAEEPAAPTRGMRGPRGPGSRLYDPKTVGTLTGEVVAVRRLEGRRSAGVHLELMTGDGTVAVHLGPAWFLEKERLQIGQGDKVEITGSRVSIGGKPAVIAQVVKKGDTAVALRDMNGVPVWAGRGGR
jgi:hypothetical protein